MILIAALVSAGAAHAHATLVGSEPADGAVLADAPRTFRLIFNEPVAATSLRLVGGDGPIALAAAGRGGSTVEVAAPAGLPKGSYALSYRVVSEDGHPIAGAVAFSIGAAGAGLPALDQADRALQRAIWLARLALYVGLLFGGGGAFARAVLTEGAPDGRRTAAFCAVLGLLAAPAALALLGADLVGAPLTGALDPAAWRQALVTSYAWTVAISVAALVAALVSLACEGLLARVFAALALLGVGAALAASGHASAAPPQGVMRTAVFLHAVSAAFWMGALPPLLLALARNAPTATYSLRRFSAAAPFAVAALASAGLAVAIRQTEDVAALWTTDYGLVLTAKLALVAGLLALASANRWRWSEATLRGDAQAARRLRRSVAAELVLGAVILGVVALWRFTPPPRVLAIEAARPALAHLHALAAQADVTLAPGRVGRAEMTIVVMTGDFGPLDAKELTVVLSNPAASVEPIRRSARKPGDGTWRVDGLTLPVAGRWRLGIEILVTDFDLEKLEGELEVRP